VVWIKGLPSSFCAWKQHIEDNAFKIDLSIYVDAIKRCCFPGSNHSLCPVCKSNDLKNIFKSEHYRKSTDKTTLPPTIACNSCSSTFSSSSFLEHPVIEDRIVQHQIQNLKVIRKEPSLLTGVLKKVQEHDPRHKVSCFKTKGSREGCRHRKPETAEPRNIFVNSSGKIITQRNFGSEYFIYFKMLDFVVLMGSSILSMKPF